MLCTRINGRTGVQALTTTSNRPQAFTPNHLQRSLRSSLPSIILQSFQNVSSAQRRHDACLVRFKPELSSQTSSDGLIVPIECTQLLGFKSGSVPNNSEVSQAYQELLDSSALEGYSEATLESRAQLLEIARDDIIGCKAAAERQLSITIPYHLVPGALAILVEVGQSDHVLDLGHDLLSTQELDSNVQVRNDVLLSMAMACCNLAGEALEAGHQEASVACQHLEDALELLQTSGVSPSSPPLAPTLVSEIRSTLRSLRAPSIMEELLGTASKSHATGRSGPPSAAALERRKRAVRALRELLRDVDGVVRGGTAAPATPGLTVETMRGLVASLSCDELVHLMEWEQVARTSQAHCWLYPGLLKTVAVGHIVTGYRLRQPTYIKMAAAVLRQVQQQPGGGRSGASASVCMLHGVCQLLLGEVQAAIKLLMQAETFNAGRRDGDIDPADVNDEEWGAGAYAFVTQNSPVGDDGLLPGLCLFAEQWLKKAAFPLFPDTLASPPILGLSQYFDDTRVEALIAVYDEKSGDSGLLGGTPAAVAEALSTALDGARVAVAGAVSASGEAKSVLTSAIKSQPKKNLLLVAGMVVAAFGVVAAGSVLFGSRSDGDGRDRSTAAAIGTPVGLPSSRRSSLAANRIATLQSDQLDVKTAEHLIANWQVAKQACLGTSYDTSALPVVLSGQALAEARQRSAEFADKGWSMQYKLCKCKITDLDAPAASKPVVVTTTFEESASLIGRDGRVADQYSSTYEARYHMVKAREGAEGGAGWRIAKIVVVGEDGGSSAVGRS